MSLMRRPDLLTRTVNGEVIILDRAKGSVHQLNATASHIWDACDGTQSVADIVAGVAASFAETPETVLRDVIAALADFQKLGLLWDRDIATAPPGSPRGQ